MPGENALHVQSPNRILQGLGEGEGGNDLTGFGGTTNLIELLHSLGLQEELGVLSRPVRGGSLNLTCELLDGETREPGLVAIADAGLEQHGVNLIQLREGEHSDKGALEEPGKHRLTTSESGSVRGRVDALGDGDVGGGRIATGVTEREEGGTPIDLLSVQAGKRIEHFPDGAIHILTHQQGGVKGSKIGGLRRESGGGRVR